MAATTGMTEVTASTRDATGTMEATDFEGGNDSLFERRLQLKRALELEPAGSCSRTTRHLRRQLDDVTAEIVTFNLGLVRSYCK
ncbi:MAG: hypothetical protein RLZZ623_425, partial [Actinomycetota bacterium]